MAGQRLAELATTMPASPRGPEPVALPLLCLRIVVATADARHLKRPLARLQDELQHAVQALLDVPVRVWHGSGEPPEDALAEDAAAAPAEPQRLDLLLPLVSLDFFASRDCRAATNRFFEQEAETGRHDLIVPILIGDTPYIGDLARRAEDSLAWRVHERAPIDWREVDFGAAEDGGLSDAIHGLAQSIVGIVLAEPLPPDGEPGEAGQPTLAAVPAGPAAREAVLVRSLGQKEVALAELQQRFRTLENQRLAEKVAFLNERNNLVPWRQRFWFALVGLGSGLVVTLIFALR